MSENFFGSKKSEELSKYSSSVGLCFLLERIFEKCGFPAFEP